LKILGSRERLEDLLDGIGEELLARE